MFRTQKQCFAHLCFTFLGLFSAQNLFLKKNKQTWNCPDNLKYNTTNVLRQLLTQTHCVPLVSFYLLKVQKTRGILMFSGGIEREQWHEIGLANDVKTKSWEVRSSRKEKVILQLWRFSTIFGFVKIITIIVKV